MQPLKFQNIFFFCSLIIHEDECFIISSTKVLTLSILFKN